MKTKKTTDSIPRAGLAQVFEVITYLDSGARPSSTFEEVRLFLLKRSRRNAPASRVALWTVARDVLIELQKLRLVEAGALPRSQSLAARHASTPCQLTEEGRALATLYKENPGRAYDRMLVTWLSEHPYFRTLLKRLHRGALYIPDITSIKQLGPGFPSETGLAALPGRISGNCLERLSRAGFSAEKVQVFSRVVSEEVQPLLETVAVAGLDVKKWIDAIQDKVVIPAFLAAEELSFDAVTFQQLLKAARDFFAASWTTSHPNYPLRVIFPTCEFRPPLVEDTAGPTVEVSHHGKTFARERFVATLKNAYSELAKSAGAYVNAYAIRAIVCVELRIQPRVFAACLRDLITGELTSELKIYTELPFDPPPPGEDYLEIERNRIGLLKLSASLRANKEEHHAEDQVVL